jgi:hypothetical protein
MALIVEDSLQSSTERLLVVFLDCFKDPAPPLTVLRWLRRVLFKQLDALCEPRSSE